MPIGKHFAIMDTSFHFFSWLSNLYQSEKVRISGKNIILCIMSMNRTLLYNPE